MTVTDRQLAVLRAVHTYSQKHSVAPSIRDLRTLLGITSTNTVSDHLDALERKGMIVRSRRIARGICVTDAGLEALAKDTAALAPAVKLVDVNEAQGILARFADAEPANETETLMMRLALTLVARSPVCAAG